MMLRRRFLGGGLGLPLAGALPLAAAPKAKIRSYEVIPVQATPRTVWVHVRLRLDNGVTGLGEASDAFGLAPTTRENLHQMESAVKGYFELLEGKSPLEVERFRQAAWPTAGKGLLQATACSALEQAMWDAAGKLLDVPTHSFFGGKTRERFPAYANINRATKPRTPDGFAQAATRAVGEGFQQLKMAPFDGFPKPGSAAEAVGQHVDVGVACIAAVRKAVGEKVQLMVDCHSFFTPEQAILLAQRLEPFALTWYEEPVAPERTQETRAIREAIRQKMAGGETLFGVGGFRPLCEMQAVQTIMPDVKHCGGLLEMTRIAAMANAFGVLVAPHNPSGPLSTVASLHACAGMANFDRMEMQWGEVPWRGELLNPPERFTNGEIALPSGPGLGVTLNDKLAAKYRL